MIYHATPEDKTVDYIKTFVMSSTTTIPGSITEQDINDCRSNLYITMNESEILTGAIGFRSVIAPNIIPLLDYKCQPDDSIWEIGFIASSAELFTYADAYDLVKQSRFYANNSVFIDMDRLLPNEHFHWEPIKSALVNAKFRMKDKGKYMVKYPASIEAQKRRYVYNHPDKSRF